MAAVVLDQVWIALASNLAAPITAYSSGFASGSGSQSAGNAGVDIRAGQGEVRMYASGRARNVVAVGTKRSYQMTLRMVSSSDMLTLESWINLTVLFRDRVGRKCFGVFNQIQPYDYKGQLLHDVTLTIVEVTTSEAV
jgi:hypothetical protein